VNVDVPVTDSEFEFVMVGNKANPAIVIYHGNDEFDVL